MPPASATLAGRRWLAIGLPTQVTARSMVCGDRSVLAATLRLCGALSTNG